MFDRIAARYDFLNRSLSLGQDLVWRRRMRRHLPPGPDLQVLDLATGTADQLIALAADRRVTRGTGLDLAEQMLAIGRVKIERRGLAGRLQLATGDACAVPQPDASVDVVSLAFGIRNVESVETALAEIHRVLKPGGRTLILEFSLPRRVLLRKAYLFYFRHVLPRIGAWVSGDAHAYRYLNQTVESFPYGEDFCALLRQAGFQRVTVHPQTFGIASIYVGDKPA
jgi:demethylmenaquinone methyltransferase / 2-methoxy-6-polyprenyl-1,4-benzoquinol methylase